MLKNSCRNPVRVRSLNNEASIKVHKRVLLYIFVMILVTLCIVASSLQQFSGITKPKIIPNWVVGFKLGDLDMNLTE